jgi:hypothetical protein
MKKIMLLITIPVILLLSTGLSYAQATSTKTPALIVLYKGDVAGTGTGINGFKLKVGEEMTLTAKGLDSDGNEVNIWPTWKSDKELSIMVVEGRSKTVVVKALKKGNPLFVTAVFKTDDGKKITGEAMGEVKDK